MLLAAPQEIINKFKYENGEPVAICELTEEEQKIFDEFYETFMREKKHRFEDIDED